MPGFLVVLALFFISSCSSLKSGHYVQLKKHQTLDDVAKEVGVSSWLIKRANQGRKVASGSWIFVPLPRGIIGNSRNVSARVLLSNGKLKWPVPSRKNISSNFGRRWGKSHQGIDIPARVGSAVVAAADGVVVYSNNGIGGYGNLTVLAHQGGLFTVYAHAKVNHTREGDMVYQGQVIAEVGTTGRSTGPHLHFEVRYDSQAVDPMGFLAIND